LRTPFLAATLCAGREPPLALLLAPQGLALLLPLLALLALLLLSLLLVH
jgi:hypothetical protein